MVKKLNEENSSLKEQIEELDDKLTNNQEVYHMNRSKRTFN